MCLFVKLTTLSFGFNIIAVAEFAAQMKREQFGNHYRVAFFQKKRDCHVFFSSYNFVEIIMNKKSYDSSCIS